MPLQQQNINVVSGVGSPSTDVKGNLFRPEPDTSLVSEIEGEGLATDNAMPAGDTDLSSEALSPAPQRGADANASQDVAVDAPSTPNVVGVSLELVPPPPLTGSGRVKREDTPAEEDFLATPQIEDAAHAAEANAAPRVRVVNTADAEAEAEARPSPKPFLIPVVAFGNRYDVPVTSDTPLFSVIREVAEMAVPPERADALGEVEAILYHDNVPLDPDSTVGELPENSVLHFHLSASATAKMSDSLTFFPSQLRSRRATSHAETALLPSFRNPAPTWGHPGVSQTGSHAPMLLNANGQSVIGSTYVTSHQRASLASSAPFYIGGNVSVAPSVAAQKRKSAANASTAAGAPGVSTTSRAALSPTYAAAAAGAGAASAAPSDADPPGTTCWVDADGAACYRSVQVASRRVPILDTRACPPPAHPERLADAGNASRVRSLVPPVMSDAPGGGAVYMAAGPRGSAARASAAYSVAPLSAWGSPYGRNMSVATQSILPFHALQAPLPRLQSTASAPSVLAGAVSAPAPIAAQPHGSSASLHREAATSTATTAGAGCSISEEMKEESDRLMQSTMYNEQFSIVYVHLPLAHTKKTNAFGEVIDEEDGAATHTTTASTRRAGRLGEAAGKATEPKPSSTASLPSLSPQRSEMRKLRFDRDFPVGTLREMFSVPITLPLYAGAEAIEDERKSMNDLQLEGYTVFSFSNKRPSSALIAAPYLNSPAASPPPSGLDREIGAGAVPPHKVLSLSDLSRPALTHTASTSSPSSGSVAPGLYAVMPSAGAFWSAAPAIQPVLVAGSDGRLVSMAPLQLNGPHQPQMVVPLQHRPSLVLSPIQPISMSGSAIYGDLDDEELISVTALTPSGNAAGKPNKRRQSCTAPDPSLWASTTLSSHRHSSSNALLQQNTTQPFAADSGHDGAARRSTISAVLQDAEEQGARAGPAQNFVFPPTTTTTKAASQSEPGAASHHHLAPLAETTTTATSPAADTSKRSSEASRGSAQRASLSGSGAERRPSRLQPLAADAEAPEDTASEKHGSSLRRIASGSLKRVKNSFSKLTSSHSRNSPPAEEAANASTTAAAVIEPQKKSVKKSKKSTEKRSLEAENPQAVVAPPVVAARVPDPAVTVPATTPIPAATVPQDEVALKAHHPHHPNANVLPPTVSNVSFLSSDGENGAIDIDNLSSASVDLRSSRNSDVDLPAPVCLVTADGKCTPIEPPLSARSASRSSSLGSRRPTPLTLDDLERTNVNGNGAVPTAAVPTHVSSPPRKRSGTLAPHEAAPLRAMELEMPTSHADDKNGSKRHKKTKASKSPKRRNTPIPGVLKKTFGRRKGSKDDAGEAEAVKLTPKDPSLHDPRATTGTTNNAAIAAQTRRASRERQAREGGRAPNVAGSPHRQSYTASTNTSFDGDAQDSNSRDGHGARLVRKGSGHDLTSTTAAATRYDNVQITPTTSERENQGVPPDTSISMGPVALSGTHQPGALAAAAEPAAEQPLPVPRRASPSLRDSEPRGSGSSASSHNGTTPGAPNRWELTPSPASILVPTRQYSNNSPSHNSGLPVKYITRSNSFHRNSQQSPCPPGEQPQNAGSPTLAGGLHTSSSSPSSPHAVSSRSGQSPVPADRRNSSSASASGSASASLTSPRVSGSPNAAQRFSVDSTGSSGRIRISLCDPMDNSKINFNVPVEADCPVGVLREWLREEVTERLKGKDIAVPRFQNRLEYGVFCGDARVIDDAVLTFAEATGGKNDCVFSLRKLVDDRSTGIAQFGSFHGISQREPSSKS